MHGASLITAKLQKMDETLATFQKYFFKKFANSSTLYPNYAKMRDEIHESPATSVEYSQNLLASLLLVQSGRWYKLQDWFCG